MLEILRHAKLRPHCQGAPSDRNAGRVDRQLWHDAGARAVTVVSTDFMRAQSCSQEGVEGVGDLPGEEATGAEPPKGYPGHQVGTAVPG